MLKLNSFRKANLGLQASTAFIGGRWGQEHIGCVGCDGNTKACMDVSTCVKITCKDGNDVGGTDALDCGSSVSPIGQTTI